MSTKRQANLSKKSVVNKAPTKDTGTAAEIPMGCWPVSLLLLSLFFVAFFWVQDWRRGISWDEMAYDYADYTIPVDIAVIAVLVGIGQIVRGVWGGKPPAEFTKPVTKPGPLDILRAIWPLAVIFCPLLVWPLGNFDRTPSNWRVLFGISAILTIVLPLVCVLPWLGYVRGRAAPLILAILAIGTAFPALSGLASAIDLVRGPEWQTVRVTTFGADELRLVKLSDGRMLRYPEKLLPALHFGVHRFLVLRASRYILDVR